MVVINDRIRYNSTMPRVIFQNVSSRINYFTQLREQSNLSWAKIAQSIGVSVRQLHDWRVGKYSFSQATANIILTQFGVELPKDIEVKDDYWHILKIARRAFEKKRKLVVYSVNTEKGSGAID